MTSLNIQFKYKNIIQIINLFNLTKKSLGIFFNTQIDYLIDEENQIYLPNEQGIWTNLDNKTVYTIKSMYIYIYNVSSINNNIELEHNGLNIPQSTIDHAKQLKKVLFQPYNILVQNRLQASQSSSSQPPS